MKIRTQIFLALILMAIALFSTIAVALNIFFLSNVQQLEHDNSAVLLNGIEKNFELQAETLLRGCADYADWDSCYDFAEGKNPEFVGRDYSNATLSNLDLDVFIVVLRNGTVFYVDTTLGDEWENSATRRIEVSEQFTPDGDSWSKKGYVNLAGESLIVVARPILRSDSSGPFAGVLLWGRALKNETLEKMLPITGSRVEVDLRSAKSGVMQSRQDIQIISDTQLQGQVIMSPSIESFDDVQVTAIFERTIYAQTKQSITLFLAALAFFQTLTIFACMKILDVRLIKSLNNVNSQVSNLRADRKLALIQYDRKTELTPIIDKLNNVIEEVERYKVRLAESERLAAIGKTASMVGHDLRNPLQVITMTTYFFKKTLQKESLTSQDKEVMKQYLDTLDEQALYMNRIVEDVQNYAKPPQTAARRM